MFGYASLAALNEPAASNGCLRGFRRCWGVAMNNWEGGEEAKHWLDRSSGERPRIRIAYLDLREENGSTVNGLALPVDSARLEALDRRELNYERVEVTAAFEPELGARVFAYFGLAEARERCHQGAADGNIFVSRDYLTAVRSAFEGLASDALPEFDRTTDPLPFPERDLSVVLPLEGS